MQESDCIISLDIVSISNDYLIEGLCKNVFFQIALETILFTYTNSSHCIINSVLVIPLNNHIFAKKPNFFSAF